MKSGTLRKIDRLGRIVLPVEFRRALGLEPGSGVALRLEGETIVIIKQENSCGLCGSTEDVVRFESGALCRKCLDSIRAADRD